MFVDSKLLTSVLLSQPGRSPASRPGATAETRVKSTPSGCPGVPRLGACAFCICVWRTLGAVLKWVGRLFEPLWSRNWLDFVSPHTPLLLLLLLGLILLTLG